MREKTQDDFCYTYLGPAIWKKGTPESAEVLEERYEELLGMHFAYLRGTFEEPKHFFKGLPDGDDRKITAATIAIVCAISTGDYETYEEVEQFCKEARAVARNPYEEKISEYPMLLAYTSMHAVELIPDWIKAGDFSDFPEGFRAMVWHLYVMYLLADHKVHEVYGAALGAKNLCERGETFTYLDIYFLLYCGIGAYQEGNTQKARSFVEEALALGMPYGIMAPFAEMLIWLGGVLEDCMAEHYPKEYKQVIKLWKATSQNWIEFHNRFAKEHITKLLTSQEYHVALLLSKGDSYAECAKKMNLSVGRVKNIISAIYSKLYIKSRKELGRFVH